MYKLINENNGIKQYIISKRSDIDKLDYGFGNSAYCIREAATYYCDWCDDDIVATWYPDFLGIPYEQKILKRIDKDLKKGEETPIIKPRDPKLQEVSI